MPLLSRIGPAGFGPQTALLSLKERWKIMLDNKGYIGTVIMDLSKALDTMNYELGINC